MSTLIPCKSCKHQVDKTAKTCPSCGVSNPGQNASENLKGCLFFVLLMITVVALMNSCGEEEVLPQHKITVNQTQPYQILSNEDFSFAGRKRYQFNITAPLAKTHTQLTHTAINAAQELQRQYAAQVIYIFIGETLTQIDNGNALVIARYAPDGGGNSGDQDWTWQVEAIDSPLVEGEFPNRKKINVKQDL